MKDGPDLVGGDIEDLGDFTEGHAGFEVFEDGLNGHAGSAEGPGTADFAGDSFDGGALGPVEAWGWHRVAPVSLLPEYLDDCPAQRQCLTCF